MRNKIEVKLLLREKAPLILDGAMGTELELRGASVGDKLWGGVCYFDCPQLVKEIHYDYLVNGADVLITNSYQLSTWGLQETGHAKTSQDAADIFNGTISLAEDARQEYLRGTHEENRPDPLIAGSVGPYGAYIANGAEYTGDYGEITDDRIREYHQDRLRTLIDSPYIDLVAIETVPQFQEIKVLVEQFHEMARGVDGAVYFLSMSIRDASHLADGTEIQAVIDYLDGVSDLWKDHLVAFGVNCCDLVLADEALKTITAAFAESSNLRSMPLVVYPNSGEVYDGITKLWSDGEGVKSGKSLASLTPEWVEDGARLIGGCCRTRPADIRNTYELVTKLYK